jgi:acetylornithine aminotransferase
MGNGFPIAGVLIDPKFEASHGLLGTTFGGNHLACAAGIAVLDVLEKENLIERAKQSGQILMEGLKTMSGIKEIRGMGLMIGIDLGQSSAEIRKKLLKEGKIFTGSSSDPNVIRLLPPLNIGDLEINLFLEKFNQYIS